MLRATDDEARRIEKLTRINDALIQRLERMDDVRGSSWSLTRTAAMLEREIVERNADLERALAELGARNAELAAARETADEANRAKSRFLRAASHDLLQPLSAGRLFLGQLEDLAGDTVQADLIGRVIASFESAEELIRALLDIARLDSAAFEANPGPVAISRLFQRLAIDLQPLAAARGIDLRFVPSTETVLSDPVLLRQIAQNLIINALKYSTGPKVVVGLKRDGPGAWLTVQDGGPGIGPADHDRIFNEFERLSRTDAPGSGLGLSIVRRACQQLGHEVALVSAVGRGSRFRVRLPLMRGVCLAPEESVPAGGAAAGADALAGRRALIVENDRGMREAFGMLLGSWGMEVADAGSIAEARAVVAAGWEPDVVLTDFRLDGEETGVQAIEAVRRRLGRAAPALVVSAEGGPEIRALAAPFGAPLLEKPVGEGELRRALAALLGAPPAAAAPASRERRRGGA
ncbi:hybrid sensor histidine kinase/response regulator [Amaricoccus sp.]|uniref:hybrid sensor histidine kinase/response regulator n=1 Tax=Amaricoccus sp. TaxID=1872485 RepID=UPI001B759A6F|nr:hybrid sensor histidine kinase/response regulator [Amaricoccus sp.]MBP7001120.1 hybrid sensor histidine kinase/response regulator [Amaricoccus sp.]